MLPHQTRKHEVRPGITGWAQVNGRNAITWEEKFKLDVWYVESFAKLQKTNNHVIPAKAGIQ